MAYSNYGSFVYLNGKRREDKEDTYLYNEGEVLPKGKAWEGRLFHGVVGDGDVRIAIFKELFGLWNKGEYIDIFKVIDEDTLGRLKEDDSVNVESDGEYDLDYEYSPFTIEYHGYYISFESKRTKDHYVVEMTTLDGDEWKCVYDSAYGAGWTD